MDGEEIAPGMSSTPVKENPNMSDMPDENEEDFTPDSPSGMPDNPYEEDPDVMGYGFEAPPAMDSFTAADPYAEYELPALDCPYEAPLPESPFDDELGFEEHMSETSSIRGDLQELPPALPTADYDQQLPAHPATNEDADVEDDGSAGGANTTITGAPDTAALLAANESALDKPIRVPKAKLSGKKKKKAQAAAAALKEAMGIDGEKKKSKRKKGKASSRTSTGSNTSVGSSKDDGGGGSSSSSKASSPAPDETDGDDDLVFGTSKTKPRSSSREGSRSASPTTTLGGVDVLGAMPTETPEGHEAAMGMPTRRMPHASSESELDVSLRDEAQEIDLVSPNDYLFVHKRRLDSIEGAIGAQGRIKYTCVDASRNYLVFGANTGGAYIFTREKNRFLQLINATESFSVTACKFSHDERTLAIGTNTGAVFIYTSTNWGNSRQEARCLKAVREHDGASITSLAWMYGKKRIVSADEMGLVVATPVQVIQILPGVSSVLGKLAKMKNLAKVVSTVLPDAEVVFRCKSKVLQVDTDSSGDIVMSCETRVYVAKTKERRVFEVGHRLREGEFGACLGTASDGSRQVFCARPGARVWQANPKNGKVKSTINLKEHFDRPSTPIVSTDSEPSEPAPSDGPMGYHFKQLLLAKDRYLLSWTPTMLFVIDTRKARLGGWYSDVQGIVDVTVVGDDVYVLHSNQGERDAAARAGRSSPVDAPMLQYHCEHMSLLTPGELVGHMLENERVIDAAEMILEYRQNTSLDCFLEHVQGEVLTLLRHKLAEEPGEMAAHLEVKMTELAMESASERVERENARVQEAENSVTRMGNMFSSFLGKSSPAGKPVKPLIVDASLSPESTSMPAESETKRALILGE